MFQNRYRSHHHAEAGIREALNGPRPSQPAKPTKMAKPMGAMPSITWDDVKAELAQKSIGAEKGGALYIHVPYCDKICSFCNLTRQKGQGSELDGYVDYILDEVQQLSELKYIQEEVFDVIYLGGGTPTILTEAALVRLLKGLRHYLPIAPNCEISVESTLHNLGPSKIESLKSVGVNRLSIGIQTFSTSGRKVLNRTGKEEYALSRLEGIRSSFKDTLSIDIIYSYPQQSLDALKRDAQHIQDLKLDGASFYSLMIHPGSELATSLDNGTIEFERSLESEKAKHHEFLNMMRSGGYELLELSKIVRPGRDDYRYIRKTYDNKNIIPLGVGSGGRIANFSIYNMSAERKMIAPTNPEFDKYNKVLGSLQYGDYSFDNLQTLIGGGKESLIQESLDLYRSHGYLEGPQGDDRLSVEGVFWGNNIAVDLLSKVIKEDKK